MKLTRNGVSKFAAIRPESPMRSFSHAAMPCVCTTTVSGVKTSAGSEPQTSEMNFSASRSSLLPV